MNKQDFIIEEEPYTFGGTQLVLKKYVGTDPKVYVPAEVKKISSMAFADNPYVEAVVLPSELEVIDSCAFSARSIFPIPFASLQAPPFPVVKS